MALKSLQQFQAEEEEGHPGGLGEQADLRVVLRARLSLLKLVPQSPSFKAST